MKKTSEKTKLMAASIHGLAVNSLAGNLIVHLHNAELQLAEKENYGVSLFRALGDMQWIRKSLDQIEKLLNDVDWEHESPSSVP